MSVIKTGQDYQDNFDIDRYMDHFYTNPSDSMKGMIEFILQTFHDAFSDGKIKGKTQLDIGPGPTIHSIISSSNHVDDIYMADFNTRNIDVLNLWLNGKRNIQDNMVERVCVLENKGQSPADRISQMRQKVKKITEIDVTTKGSLKGDNLPSQFDVVTSAWCLESAGQPKETYIKCANHIFSLVKPGGHFILFGNFDTTLFIMDDDKFPVIEISEAELRKVYEDAGFKILNLKKGTFHDENMKGDTLFSMTAQRPA